MDASGTGTESATSTKTFGGQISCLLLHKWTLSHIRNHGYATHESDPCTVRKTTAKGIDVIAITVDDFLVLGSTQAAIDAFYEILIKK